MEIYMTKNEYVENLRRIYVAHTFYEDADEIDRGRIYEACETLFDNVAVGYPVSDSSHGSGLDRSFGVLLLLFGKYFLKEQFDCDSLNQFVENFIE